MDEHLATARIAEDDEGCTVIYPPLSWPKGAKVLLTLEDHEQPIPYRITEAGRKALGEKA